MSCSMLAAPVSQYLPWGRERLDLCRSVLCLVAGSRLSQSTNFSPILRLSVPFKRDIGSITDGTELVICGTACTNCDSFSVTLCSGQIIETDDVAFHFNPRWIENCVVRNHKKTSKWGAEEKTGGFPFQRGEYFTMNLLVNQRGYKVVVNDKHFCEFKHRLEKAEVRYLHIRGDLYINSIQHKSCKQQTLAPPLAFWPDGGPKSLRSPCGLATYKNLGHIGTGSHNLDLKNSTG
ncbi:galectin [Plakobranchus ocellatus]|uniref:Galectin n=1 Tax=Plakobranchus ocellatus TaxID=259542 RepID=A0AAV4DFA2_9GAST|nr:galectin [Plakobranchus ocellatus]